MRAEDFEGVDVRAVIELAGHLAVPAAVAGEKGDRDAVEIADDERIARLAEGRGDVALLDHAQAVHLVEAGAADDADGHAGTLS